MIQNLTFNPTIECLKIFELLDKNNEKGINLFENLDFPRKKILSNVNKLRKAGFNISRNKDIFKLEKYYNNFKLNDIDTSLLAHTLTLAHTFLDKKSVESMKRTIKKISQMSKDEDIDIVFNKYDEYKDIIFKHNIGEKPRILFDYLENHKEVKLILMTNEIVHFYISDIYRVDDDIFVSYFDNENQEQEINIDNIIKIMDINEPIPYKMPNETFFELYGRLKKSYLLKDKERLVECHKNRIVIASSEENKKALFQRLLRYDSLCVVIMPKRDARAFKNLISSSISNLSFYNSSIEAEEIL